MTGSDYDRTEIGILKRDVTGRVRTSARQREALMDEFERSGVSGPKFAETVGICYQSFAGWMQGRRREVWEDAASVLATAARQQKMGRARRAPRHAILDGQSVKSAAEGEERGFHGGKKIKSRSRRVAVDSQGSLLAVKVAAANRSDSAEAGAVMAEAVESHPSLGDFHRGSGL